MFFFVELQKHKLQKQDVEYQDYIEPKELREGFILDNFCSLHLQLWILKNTLNSPLFFLCFPLKDLTTFSPTGSPLDLRAL